MTEWGIDTLFNPGKRHMDEEKRRLQSTREEVGDSSGGRRIDLESGTVTISRPGKKAPADDPEAAEAEPDEAEEGEAAEAGPDEAAELAAEEAGDDEEAERSNSER
ncbi:MAG TPA: DUF6191 domain-containing protein [Jatrophihabitans sp.]|jgi:hypothetical protein|nr:DUF6191 domain-containing protein [Jatrophihabitans sp.]